MRIGIDLDNTIVDYDMSFSAAARSFAFDLPEAISSKFHIREYFRSQDNGEEIWQQLQGLVYGKMLPTHARLFPGVKRFLWRCRKKGHHVEIVSHKTEYGHFDLEKLPIRTLAVSFLESKEILGGDEPLVAKITFESTREEKSATIIGRHFDWFIDDLTEVIHELSEDKHLKKILFDPLGNQGSAFEGDTVKVLSDWQQIDAVINGEWTIDEIKYLAYDLLHEETLSVEKISGGGNAGVYKVTLAENRSLKLKIYPVDATHDRLHSEYLASTVFSGMEGNDLPRPVAQDVSLGIGMYEWVEGERLGSHTLEEIRASLAFLKKLHSVKDHPQFSAAQRASAACLSCAEIENQLSNRVANFSNARKAYPELDAFLSNHFQPLMNELIAHAREKFSSGEYRNKLTKEEQTLSPSDFGFHNMIRRADGQITFLDFEYFGWDDPVKLISDFSFHPGMSLTDEQVNLWLQGAVAVYGERISNRLQVCRPLYGLIWCLILLNDFRPEIWERRVLADKSKQAHKKQTLDSQMEKACKLLAKIQQTYSCNFITK